MRIKRNEIAARREREELKDRGTKGLWWKNESLVAERIECVCICIYIQQRERERKGRGPKAAWAINFDIIRARPRKTSSVSRWRNATMRALSSHEILTFLFFLSLSSLCFCALLAGQCPCDACARKTFPDFSRLCVCVWLFFPKKNYLMLRLELKKKKKTMRKLVAKNYTRRLKNWKKK